MAKKKKKSVPSQKKSLKKAQKQKQRNEKNRKQKAQVISSNKECVNIEESVAEVLEMIEFGNLKDAHRLLKKLTTKHRNNADVLFTNGFLAANDNRLTTAISYFNKCLAIDPDYIDSYHNLALLYLKTDQLSKSLICHQEIIKRGQEDDELVVESTDMLKEYEQLIMDNSECSISEYIKAETYFDSAQDLFANEEWLMAIDLFGKTVALSPKFKQAYCNIGVCYMKLGNEELALYNFDKAIEIDPEYNLAIVNREILTENGIDKARNSAVKNINSYTQCTGKDTEYVKSLLTNPD